jgi:hypothetical protein
MTLVILFKHLHHQQHLNQVQQRNKQTQIGFNFKKSLTNLADCSGEFSFFAGENNKQKWGV